MRTRRVRDTGFTLVELMIVVAIVGVLAVVAGTAYRKYGARARAAEVYAMFGEIRVKEEAYRAEYSFFCSSAAAANSAAGCATGNEDTLWPLLLGANEPRAKAWAGPPAGWTYLGINPGKSQLYCGYVAVAGDAAGFAGGAGTRGTALWTSAPPTTVWWYASAKCDNDGQPSVNATYTTGQNTTSVVVANEGR